MSILYAPLISFLIGALIFLAVMPPPYSGNLFLNVFFAIGVGLGISAQITFYSFLLVHKFDPPVILSANFIVLVLLLIINRQSLRIAVPALIKNKHFSLPGVGVGLVFVAIGGLTYYTASGQPFGQWDAWALWNMKTKFLIFGGTRWTDIFKLHWHTQPDYPLLLPFINTWIFAVLQKYFNFVPALTSLIFTLACAGLLYAGLARYIPTKIAFISALTFVTLPVYPLWGTYQYADIVLTYYLLAGVIFMTMTLREKNSAFAVLLGIILGLMSFTKNEGIIMAGLLSILTIVYLVMKKTIEPPLKIKILAGFFVGLLLTTPPTLILKWTLAPVNRDMGLGLAQTQHPFLNWQGLDFILKKFGSVVFDPRFMLIGLPLTIMFLLQPRLYFKKELKPLTLFFIFYFLCLCLVYLTTIHFDLQWRLSRTATRAFMIQLPAMLFLNLYAYWHKDD